MLHKPKAIQKVEKMLENSEDRQLVWNSEQDCLQAVIYKKGKIDLPRKMLK